MALHEAIVLNNLYSMVGDVLLGAPSRHRSVWGYGIPLQ